MPPTAELFKDYDLNNFKAKKLRGRYILINDSGSWVALDQPTYSSMLAHRLTGEWYSLLESKGIILTRKNIKALAEDYKAKKPQLFQGTSLHIIVVTLRCNQECVYCHSASRPASEKQWDMNEETARKTVDFIFQTTSKAITIEFQGGEPLLNLPIVKYIIRYAKDKNKNHAKDLRFSIVTNLTLMTKDILDYLAAEDIGICTSLDGPAEIHDKNRTLGRGSGAHDLVVRWIKEIKQMDRDVNAIMVTTRHSLAKPAEILDEYRSLRLNRIWFRFLNNLGSASKSWKDISYTPEEYLDFWKRAMESVYTNYDIIEISSAFILQKILTKKDPMYLDMMSPCGAAIGQMAYHYNGEIYSCDEGRMLGEDFFRLGNVYESTYRELMSSPKTCSLIASSVNDNYMCSACPYQPYCGLCPVSCFANTGNIIPKLPVDFRCRILKGQFDYLFERLVFDRKFNEVIENSKLKLSNPFKFD